MKSLNICRVLILATSFLVATSPTLANTSGVHGPNVKDGERSMQLRLALSPADNDETDNWASRLHYQHAINDYWRFRAIVQYRDRGSLTYDYLRAEALYNFKKREAGERWSSGLRFDLRTRRGDRPEMVSVNWTNQWDLSDDWRLRAIAIVDREFGSSRASSGILFSTRFSATTKLTHGLTVGLESFNEFGALSDISPSQQQSHQIGPVIGGSFGNDYKWEFRYLRGLTEEDRNSNFGFRINKSF